MKIITFSRLFISFFFFFFLSGLFLSDVNSQNHQASVQFVELFNTLQEELPREYVYLHTDRQWYVHGDRIWFSAYVVAGSYLRPSGISSVLYVELIEPDGRMANRVALNLERGRASGSLTFDNSEEAPGTYRLRAYTAWSLNFGESYVFDKDIHVFTDFESAQITSSENKLDLQFLPEGGHLVENLPTRLAFKAVGSDGLGVNISGTIYDENSDFSQTFESGHLGMGVIENFKPEPGAVYVAEVNGVRHSLPQVKTAGAVLSVDQNENQYLIDIQSQNLFTDEALLLFAHVRGLVSYASLVLMEDGHGAVSISKDQFPTGIVHFTLLGTDGRPVTERLAFNKNELDQLEADIDINNNIFAKRSEVNLSFSLSNVENITLPSTASLSVFDDNINEFDAMAKDIRSHFYLETELKGYIENPAFYFSDDADADRYLDMLLLSQGWRAYNMDEVANLDELNIFSLPELGFTMSGTIKSGLSGQPLEDATVVFSIGSEHHNVDLITTDENGNFILTDLQINGSELITIRANTASGSDNVQIEVDNQFGNLPEFDQIMPQLPPDLNQPFGFNRDENATPLNIRAEMAQIDADRFAEAQMFGELEEIVVTTDRQEAADQFERDLRMGEHSGQRIDFDNNKNLADLPLLQAINQLAGVSVNMVTGGLRINTGFQNISGGHPPPLILVDNIQADFEYLRSLSTSDVQSVNVFRRSAELGFFGSRAAGGVLSVSTRRGRGIPGRDMRGLVTALVQGYHPPTEFYSPRYGITVPRDLEQEDNRITLHWEGNIKLTDNSANIRFWTNDVPSSYRIVIEGITETGIPFTGSEIIEVRD